MNIKLDDKAIHKGRAIYYGLFASLFAFVDKENRFNGVKETIDVLAEYPITEESRNSLEKLKTMLSNGYEDLEDEYERIFFDPNSPIRTTASYYDEGYESGRKRVEMIEYILKTKFRKDENKYKDTEDDVGFIFSFMYYLIQNSDENENYVSLQKDIFENILNIFIDDFIDDVYGYEESGIFKEICVVLKDFMDFERVFFDVPEQKGKEGTVARDKSNVVYVNLKRRGKHRKIEEAQACGLDDEEEEPVEDNI